MNSLNHAAFAATLQELTVKINNTITVRAPNRLDPMPLVKLLREASFEMDRAAEYIVSIKSEEPSE